MKKQAPEELVKYKLYTLTELEPILGLTHVTLLNYVNSGKLKAVKIGGKWRVSEQALKNLIKGK
jgi:excisionase family DNA binding protein